MYGLTFRLIAIAFFLLSGMVHLHGKIIPQQLSIEKVQGLPQTDYYETAQDAQGFIYFATDLGLLRYDWQRVIHLSDIGILHNKSVFSVRAFKNGHLLIFVKDQGYFLYRQNKFYPFKINALINNQPALTQNGFAVLGNNFITSDGKEVYINSSITLKSMLLSQQHSGAVSNFLLNGQSVNLPSDNTIPNIIKKATGFTPIPKPLQFTNIFMQNKSLAAAKANTLFFKTQKHTTKIELPCKPFHIFIDNANNLWITHGVNGVSKSIYNAISFYDFPLEISQVSHFGSFFVLGNGYKLFKTNDFSKYSKIQGQPPRLFQRLD